MIAISLETCELSAACLWFLHGSPGCEKVPPSCFSSPLCVVCPSCTELAWTLGLQPLDVFRLQLGLGHSHCLGCSPSKTPSSRPPNRNGDADTFDGPVAGKPAPVCQML